VSKAKFVSFDDTEKKALCDRCKKVNLVKRFYFLANKRNISKHFCSNCFKNVLSLREYLSFILNKNRYKRNFFNKLKNFFNFMFKRTKND